MFIQLFILYNGRVLYSIKNHVLKHKIPYHIGTNSAVLSMYCM